MRPIAALLSLLLPLAPFVFLLQFSSYPGGLVIALMAITSLIGLVSVVKRKRAGLAGLFSAMISSVLAMLGSGYIPYLAHFSLGSFAEGSASLFGMSVAASLYGHYMGNVYESTTRLSATFAKMKYEQMDIRELDKMAMWSAGVGVVAFAISCGLYLLMNGVSFGSAFSSLIMLAIFLTIYGFVITAVRRHTQGGELR